MRFGTVTLEARNGLRDEQANRWRCAAATSTTRAIYMIGAGAPDADRRKVALKAAGYDGHARDPR